MGAIAENNGGLCLDLGLFDGKMQRLNHLVRDGVALGGAVQADQRDVVAQFIGDQRVDVSVHSAHPF